MTTTRPAGYWNELAEHLLRLRSNEDTAYEEAVREIAAAVETVAGEERTELVDITSHCPNLVELAIKPEPGQRLGRWGLEILAVCPLAVTCQIAGRPRKLLTLVHEKDRDGRMLTLAVYLGNE